MRKMLKKHCQSSGMNRNDRYLDAPGEYDSLHGSSEGAALAVKKCN